MFRQIYLPLVPVTWSQTLTHEGATILRARMKWEATRQMRVEAARRHRVFPQHEVELTILDGEIRAEDRIKYKLVEEAIGGLSLARRRQRLRCLGTWMVLCHHDRL